MPTYITNERTIETEWECYYCRRWNRGLVGEGQGMVCPKCGAAKKVKDYRIPEDTTREPSLTNPVLLELAETKPNRTCPKCSMQVRADQECPTCGKGITSAPRVPRPRFPPAPQPIRIPTLDFHEEEAALRAMKRSPSRPWFWIVVVLASAAFLGLIVWLFTPHDTVGTVVGVSWHRTEMIKERSTEHASGWGWPPADSFHQSCEQRQDGTEDCECVGGDDYQCNPRPEKYDCQCKPGGTYECGCEKEVCVSKGNGAAKCTQRCKQCDRPEVCKKCTRTAYDTCTHPRKCQQCPVYRQWCEYDHDVWSTIRQEDTKGSDLTPRWFGLEAQGADQRVERKEDYRVMFQAGSESWTEQPRSLSTFQRFDVGKRFHVRYTYAGTHDVLNEVK